MSEINEASILEMAMGAISERVDYEMDRVIKNILDRNTKATAKRKVTVELTLTPDDDRRVISISATAKSSLCPTNAIATSLYIGTDPKTGELRVQEMTPQIPGQLSAFGSEAPERKILKMAQEG